MLKILGGRKFRARIYIIGTGFKWNSLQGWEGRNIGRGKLKNGLLNRGGLNAKLFTVGKGKT